MNVRWFGPRLPSVGARLPDADSIWINVKPTYSSSNQTVKQAQGAKTSASITAIQIPLTRVVIQRGNNFELDEGSLTGPVRWKGTGGQFGYSVIGFDMNVSWLNASVDNTQPFYFGMQTGGSVPLVAAPVYLEAAGKQRGNVSISGAIDVLNGGQQASVLWPIISGAGAWAIGAIGWTMIDLYLYDTGIRI